MQANTFQTLVQTGLQEILLFFTYLSETYGSGDVSRDFLVSFTTVALLYSILKIVSYLNQDQSSDAEFEEAVGVISDALDLASIQISEMRYQLLTEFDRAKRNLELFRREHAVSVKETAPISMRESVTKPMTGRLGFTTNDTRINQLIGVSTLD